MNGGFWRGRRVLLTGHTGFKGAWLALWLNRLGARVTGFALPPAQQPALWTALQDSLPSALTGDLRNAEAVTEAVSAAEPQIVLHLAAQAQVRSGYADPRGTFGTNTGGTVILLEALRQQTNLLAVLAVTSDKVYRNDESGRSFREDDPLGGSDPYSASKAAAEIVVACYRESFFQVPLATARGGNVIGGGDWSSDRLVPDVVRAAEAGRPLVLRNPEARRPWQHVLDCLAGYLAYAEALASGAPLPPALNFGPPEGVQMTVASVAEQIGHALGSRQPWRHEPVPAAPEKQQLALDTSLALRSLAWRPKLTVEETLRWTADWYRGWAAGEDPRRLCEVQLERYEAL